MEVGQASPRSFPFHQAEAQSHWPGSVLLLGVVMSFVQRTVAQAVAQTVEHPKRIFLDSTYIGAELCSLFSTYYFHACVI